MNHQDQFLTNFGVWDNATNWLGTADVELPSFESLTESIKGAGLAGEVTAPVKGHYASQKIKLNWRTVHPDAIRLADPKAHSIDFRGNQQIFNAGIGEYLDQPIVVKTKCVPINFNPGKFSIGASTETANEFEVHYIKIIVDGKTVIEYDKYNFVCVINGKDVLAQVRKNIGR